jgi:hypothetical protein
MPEWPSTPWKVNGIRKKNRQQAKPE